MYTTINLAIPETNVKVKLLVKCCLDSFEWFCLQISNDEKYFFLFCPMFCDRELVIIIVYYFQIWNKKELNIIISSYKQPSSCRAINVDIPDSLSPFLCIVYCFRQVFRTSSRIGTELVYVGSSWSSCLCSSMWRGLLEYIFYELVPTSPVLSRMSGSSNFDSFRDGW